MILEQPGLPKPIEGSFNSRRLSFQHHLSLFFPQTYIYIYIYISFLFLSSVVGGYDETNHDFH